MLGRSRGEPGRIGRSLLTVPHGYRPSGLATTIDRPEFAMLIASLSLLFSSVNSLIVAGVYLAFGEGRAAAVNGFLMIFYAGSWLVFRRSGDVRRLILTAVCVSATAVLTSHVLLGGYQWSGGVLLWGIALAAMLALWADRGATQIGVSVIAAIALCMAALEPWLQTTRPQPNLWVSVIGITDVFLGTLVLIPFAVVLLVARVQAEQAGSRRLLLNVLPASVADRLRRDSAVIADLHGGATVVFADLVGFTGHAKGLSPARLVEELNTIFTAFDELCAAQRAEKIKTIGDGYLAVCGVPLPDADHLTHGCELAVAMVEAMPALNEQLGTRFSLRVGVHTGPLVAGVIGKSKFAYDVWGETVNIASRLESVGPPGVVAVSRDVARRLPPGFRANSMGVLNLKGQGSVEVLALSRRT